MSKLSKLLVMVVVILAVVTMTLKANAAGVAELVQYVTSSHTINGMKFELKSEQKNQVKKYLEENVTAGQADAAFANIKAAEKLVANSGVTKIENLSAADKSQAISLAQQAAKDVGLTLKVDTNANSFTLYNGSTVLASDSVNSLVKTGSSGSNGGGSGSGSGSAGTTTVGSTLLYTGANFALFGLLALAIVAVAVVVKKRA